MAELETLDQVNENGEVIGKGLRSDFHKDPTRIHPVVHCWLFNSKGQILWQQRSLQKATSPGKWDMSCGGHILSGHKPDETLERELFEELGLTDVKVHLVDTYILRQKTQTEFVYLYYAVINTSVDNMLLQKEEVEQIEWIDPVKAQEMVLSGERESTPFIFIQITRILQYLAKSSLKVN